MIENVGQTDLRKIIHPSLGPEQIKIQDGVTAKLCVM
jgi:hypothetical protein